ncbi:hypothetical protein, partial [Haloferula sp. A504]|uniref:hypothetical protein n=1 Tax=Haloferula sp. A504 TaxID=3373601 RepID=UPI0031C122B5|nr:hypothetical protein [Verrucomicrobiaceae bacterium E54]
MSENKTMKTPINTAANEVDVQRLVRDALRYRAIKEQIEYAEGGDGMVWATLNWCVDVYSLSPSDLDEAIDQILLANVRRNGVATPCRRHRFRYSDRTTNRGFQQGRCGASPSTTCSA